MKQVYGWIALFLLWAPVLEAQSAPWSQVAHQSASLAGQTVTLQTRLHPSEHLISSPERYSHQGRRLFFLLSDQKYQKLLDQCRLSCILSATVGVDWAGRLTMVDYRFPED